jgi:hypothetical protein
VSGLLRSPRYQRTAQALELIEQIGEFHVTQGLPPCYPGLARRPRW